IDDRLVWANIAESSSTFPQRVLWSARGQPTNYTLADGAGFADLFDLRGEIRRIARQGDRLVLYTDLETWQARIRRDDYVFDFAPLLPDQGTPYPRTLVTTPFGTFFLGRDLEVYALAGTQAVPLGPPAPGEPSRIKAYLQRTMQVDA